MAHAGRSVVRAALVLVLVAVTVAVLRAVLLRRNEARYGGPHTPYGPHGQQPAR